MIRVKCEHWSLLRFRVPANEEDLSISTSVTICFCDGIYAYVCLYHNIYALIYNSISICTS